MVYFSVLLLFFFFFYVVIFIRILKNIDLFYSSFSFDVYDKCICCCFDIRVTLAVQDNLVTLVTKDVLDPKVGTDLWPHHDVTHVEV